MVIQELFEISNGHFEGISFRVQQLLLFLRIEQYFETACSDKMMIKKIYKRTGKQIKNGNSINFTLKNCIVLKLKIKTFYTFISPKIELYYKSSNAN